jgi:flagellar biosynthesis protein FlhG
MEVGSGVATRMTSAAATSTPVTLPPIPAGVSMTTKSDSSSIVDAYATLKVLHRHAPAKPVHLVVNDAVGVRDSEHVHGLLRDAAERFLGHAVALLGTIPRDLRLAEAVRAKVPVVEFAPDSPASRAIRLIARQLDRRGEGQGAGDPGAESFWCSLTGRDA